MHEATTEGDALSRATADVLEKMFFTGVADESDGIPPAGPQIVVRVTFDGERRGVLMLGVSRSAAQTLAADFLGSEGGEDLGDYQVREVVCELTNMICGDTLSALENGSLRLSSPEVLSAEEFNPPPDANSRIFDLGIGSLAVALAFSDGDHV
jgi:CheY-specific phosphatase CheX